MPKELFPSSYECDCGHVSHFCENTIRECKRKSHRKTLHLADSESKGEEHVIVFYQGEMVDIICPKQSAKDTKEIEPEDKNDWTSF